jgi:hypothetical protein
LSNQLGGLELSWHQFRRRRLESEGHGKEVLQSGTFVTGLIHRHNLSILLMATEDWDMESETCTMMLGVFTVFVIGSIRSDKEPACEGRREKFKRISPASTSVSMKPITIFPDTVQC